MSPETIARLAAIYGGQAELARRVGVSPATINRYIRDQRRPTGAEREALARALEEAHVLPSAKTALLTNDALRATTLLAENIDARLQPLLPRRSFDLRPMLEQEPLPPLSAEAIRLQREAQAIADFQAALVGELTAAERAARPGRGQVNASVKIDWLAEIARVVARDPNDGETVYEARRAVDDFIVITPGDKAPERFDDFAAALVHLLRRAADDLASGQPR